MPPRNAVTCRSGGIGRRAWFRSMYPQGCGGSSPFFGTSASIPFPPSNFFLTDIAFLTSIGPNSPTRRDGSWSLRWRAGSKRVRQRAADPLSIGAPRVQALARPELDHILAVRD
jgi:hypothetical protein